MADMEKVISGLKHHRDRCEINRELCPYFSDKDRCVQNLCDDTLELLKTKSEIVRCKYCKYSSDYSDMFPSNAFLCHKQGIFHSPEWFCADGERR